MRSKNYLGIMTGEIHSLLYILPSTQTCDLNSCLFDMGMIFFAVENVIYYRFCHMQQCIWPTVSSPLWHMKWWHPRVTLLLV